MALARKPFVILDAEILSSSVWSEAAHVRLVWITLLILCDTEGYVGAAMPGIARAAGVSLPEAEDAMARLQQPDPHSRTKACEGRRLEIADRGFRVLNFMEHLDRLSAERKKARDRVRRFRLKKKVSGNVTETLQTSQGTGTSEQGPVTSTEVRKEEPPALPPADRAERAIRQSTDALRTRLYGLITAMADADPKQRDPTELMRLVTAYDKQDGVRVRGVVNASLLSHERLERSIADAEAQLQEWREPDGLRA
jgi:hypothetical protein